MDPLDTRLKALDWLLAATRSWLFQGLDSAQHFQKDDDVDWRTIGDLAYVHNMEPLLYWMLSNTEIPLEIPEWLEQRCEKAYFENFLRNEKYLSILKTLLTECEKEGIPIIVLKGPALIGRIYQDPALRTLSDLDILCSRSNLHRIVNIGRRMGYTILVDGGGPAATHHVAMSNAESGALLEFHFMPYEVIQNHPKFIELAWDRREWINVGGIHCPVLCLEMELLFNIAHLVQHQFDVSLKHFLDIAGILIFHRGKLKGDGIGTLLRDFGLEQAFALTTEFLSTMMCLSRMSPASPLNHKDSAQSEFNASLRDLLSLMDQDRLLDVRGVIRRFLTAIGNRKGFWNKVDYGIKALFPFSSSLIGHGIQSTIGARYFMRQCRFYGKRLLLTLKHFPREYLSRRQDSLALERAAAKNRITRQILRRGGFEQLS